MQGCLQALGVINNGFFFVFTEGPHGRKARRVSRVAAARAERMWFFQMYGNNLLSVLLLVVLILLILGALPSWPYSRGWGYYPSGMLGIILVIILILILI